MIRHETLVSTIRLYDDPAAGWFDPYQLIVTLVWDSPTQVKLVGMHGEFTRARMRELLRWAKEQGITDVYAERGAGHSIPGGKAVEGQENLLHITLS